MKRLVACLGIAAAVLGGCSTRLVPEDLPSPSATSAYPRAADYSWFDNSELVNGFSLVWVENRTPAEVVERMRGTALRDVSWSELTGGSFADELPDGSLGLAITRLQDWSVIWDLTNRLGTDDEPLRVLSQGTTVVSQYLNADRDGRFYVLQNGDVRLGFEPEDPANRYGSTPDGLADAMKRVGFDLTPPSPGGAAQKHPAQTGLALAQYVTGIYLTPEALRAQTYLLATAPVRQ